MSDTKELGRYQLPYVKHLLCAPHGGRHRPCIVFTSSSPQPHGAGLLVQNSNDSGTQAQRGSATCWRHSWDLNPRTVAPSHSITGFCHGHSHHQPRCVGPGPRGSPSLQPKTLWPCWAPEGRAGRPLRRDGRQDRPHRSSPPARRNPQAPLLQGLVRPPTRASSPPAPGPPPAQGRAGAQAPPQH